MKTVLSHFLARCSYQSSKGVEETNHTISHESHLSQTSANLLSAFRIKEGSLLSYTLRPTLDFQLGPLLLVINTTDHKLND